MNQGSDIVGGGKRTKKEKKKRIKMAEALKLGICVGGKMSKRELITNFLTLEFGCISVTFTKRAMMNEKLLYREK